MSGAHFLVVGGTRGIGHALVRHLTSASYRVSVLGRHPDPGMGVDLVSQRAVDVTDHRAMLDGIDRCVEQLGRIRTVVFMQRHRGSPEEFETDLAVSLGATRAAIEHILTAGHFDHDPSCSIVLVSSVADRYVAPEQSVGYHVAKAGLAHLMRYYALRLGSAGIRVNAVSPCVVLKPEAADFYDKNAWLVERYRTFIPLGRMGKPEDIIDAIMFLSGGSASYITGQNLVVDGGLTLRSHESLIRDLPNSES